MALSASDAIRTVPAMGSAEGNELVFFRIMLESVSVAGLMTLLKRREITLLVGTSVLPRAGLISAMLGLLAKSMPTPVVKVVRTPAGRVFPARSCTCSALSVYWLDGCKVVIGMSVNR